MLNWQAFPRKRLGAFPSQPRGWAMKVLLTTTQGEGHVRPLVPYAQALARLGHVVAVAAPDDAAAILGKAGLERHPVDFHPEVTHLGA